MNSQARHPLSQSLKEANLAVWVDKEKIWRPIPLLSAPVTVHRKAWDSLVADGRLLLKTFPKVLRWLQKPAQAELFDYLFAELSPHELKVAKEPPGEATNSATIRLDLFFEGDDLRIIEANCTIPAMQGYSDIVKSIWHGAVTSSTGLAGDSHQSNALELLHSLLAHHQKVARRPISAKPSILILAREGDSQLRELQYHRELWTKRGHRVEIVHPEAVSLTSDGRVFSGSQEFDLIYRHIFGWRLEGYPNLQPLLADSKYWHMFNPLNAHYEVKGFLAVVRNICTSRKLCDDVGISDAESASILKRVPPMASLGRTIEREGVPLSYGFDQLKQVEKIFNSQESVFKRSFGYGGRQVVMSSEIESRHQSAVKLVTKSNESQTFDSFLRWCVSSNEHWIIQKKISGKTIRGQIITPDHVSDEETVFVDASVFLSTGENNSCSGGVSRFARSVVVNIGTGGGLAPFCIESVKQN